MNVRVMKVIEAVERAGSGVESDPARFVHRYYTLDGDLLAESDDWRAAKARDDARIAALPGQRK